MPTELASWFRAELKEIRGALHAVPQEYADVPWRAGGWTRKQIVGHLLDSASNNRQRFVRAATEGRYAGPQYAQDAWVAAHGYARQPWERLLHWWEVEHEVLAAVVDEIEDSRLGATCVVGEDAPVTLRFLIEDYIRHQKWHLAQIVTQPAASKP
jgi:Mycothiol maleylpyruvate isomerase N-terminal domain